MQHQKSPSEIGMKTAPLEWFSSWLISLKSLNCILSIRDSFNPSPPPHLPKLSFPLNCLFIQQQQVQWLGRRSLPVLKAGWNGKTFLKDEVREREREREKERERERSLWRSIPNWRLLLKASCCRVQIDKLKINKQLVVLSSWELQSGCLAAGCLELMVPSRYFAPIQIRPVSNASKNEGFSNYTILITKIVITDLFHWIL